MRLILKRDLYSIKRDVYQIKRDYEIKDKYEIKDISGQFPLKNTTG